MLNKTQLQSDIESILTDMESRTSDAKPEYAQRLAQAIDDYVKGITIVYVAGLAAPNGPVSGSFQHQVT